MYGPEIVVRSISARKKPDKFGNSWQYNSRSDHHSKVACWAVLFDSLLASAKMRDDVTSGRIGFGINHKMSDFKNNKSKDLDLVICTRAGAWEKNREPLTFSSLAKKYGIVLDVSADRALTVLPRFTEASVGSVRLALEAKACMTAHGKALPRLHDELSSSHHTIHGTSDAAIAAGFVMINHGGQFLSSVSNNRSISEFGEVVNSHAQPGDTLKVLDKLEQIPRRTKQGEEGYDALGVVVVEGRNDGSPFSLVTSDPAPESGSNFSYDQLVHRLCAAYEARFPT
jgi:hypothetical protein